MRPVVESMRIRPVFLALLLAVVAATALVACDGGGSDVAGNLTGGGGTPTHNTGNLNCFSQPFPDVTEIVQGETITIVYTLMDTNLNQVAPNVPVSFEIEPGSGYIPNPPDTTDDAGRVTVTFFSDPTYLGEAFVRLIQPGSALVCEVHFVVVEPACMLTSEVLDGGENVVMGGDEDACGYVEVDVARGTERELDFHVRRLDPVSGLIVDLPGAYITIEAVGFTPSEWVVGPTDGSGRVGSGILTAIADFAGQASITATVMPMDVNGDGVADALPCNSCSAWFGIVNPECSVDDVGVDYVNVMGGAPAGPVAPGGYALVWADLTVGGEAAAGLAFVVDADHGTIDGQAAPVGAFADAGGTVQVAYVPDVGWSGTDTLRFASAATGTDCEFEVDVESVTCGMDLDFSPSPVTSGDQHVVDVTLYNVNPAWGAGEDVVLTATGGSFSPPGGNVQTLMPDGFGNLYVQATFNVTPGFTGTASISMSTPAEFGCPSLSQTFTVQP